MTEALPSRIRTWAPCLRRVIIFAACPLFNDSTLRQLFNEVRLVDESNRREIYAFWLSLAGSDLQRAERISLGDVSPLVTRRLKFTQQCKLGHTSVHQDSADKGVTSLIAMSNVSAVRILRFRKNRAVPSS